MKNRLHVYISRIVCMAGLCVGLVACAPIRPHSPQLVEYDFGVVTEPARVASLTPASGGGVVFIPDVRVSGAIEGQLIVYRYANVQAHEPRTYTQSIWVQPPAEMLRIRAQQFLGQHYLVVLNPELASRSSWTLLFTLEDFSQHFSSDQESAGIVQLRATLVHNGAIVEQRLFQVVRPAVSADAAGAVQALSQATDETLGQVLSWLDRVIGRTTAGSR